MNLNVDKNNIFAISDTLNPMCYSLLTRPKTIFSHINQFGHFQYNAHLNSLVITVGVQNITCELIISNLGNIMQGVKLLTRSLALLLSVCFPLRNTLPCPTDAELILLDCYVQIVNYCLDLTSYLKGAQSASSTENSDTNVKRFWSEIVLSCCSIKL